VQGSSSDQARGFIFDSGETASSVLDGFTITNGFLSNQLGGGIYIINANPTIQNCIISNCYARFGGGFYLLGSNSLLKNCRIINNSVQWYGGGFRLNNSSSPTIVNCLIYGNSANQGGGMHFTANCAPTFHNCTITQNSAVDSGGGIASQNGSNPTFNDCIIYDNTATNDGNEFYIISNSGDVDLNYCDYADNTGDISDPNGHLNANNCINNDPLFVDADNYDFHLQHIAAGQPNDSPCIDAGSAFFFDVSGVYYTSTRTDNWLDLTTVDIGYHFKP